MDFLLLYNLQFNILNFELSIQLSYLCMYLCINPAEWNGDKFVCDSVQSRTIVHFNLFCVGWHHGRDMVTWLGFQ